MSSFVDPKEFQNRFGFNEHMAARYSAIEVGSVDDPIPSRVHENYTTAVQQGVEQGAHDWFSPFVPEPSVDDPECKAIVDELLKDEPPEQDPYPTLTNRQRAYLERYQRVGSHIKAAKGLCRITSHYVWMRTSADYAEAFEDVVNLRKDELLARACSLALYGEKTPVFQGGQPSHAFPEMLQYYAFRRDNRLLMFLIGLFDSHERRSQSKEEADRRYEISLMASRRKSLDRLEAQNGKMLTNLVSR